MYIAPLNWKRKKQNGMQVTLKWVNVFQAGQPYNTPLWPSAIKEPLLIFSFFSLVIALWPPLGLAAVPAVPVPVVSPSCSSSAACLPKPYFLRRFLLKVVTVRSLAILFGSEKKQIDSILSYVFKWVTEVITTNGSPSSGSTLTVLCQLYHKRF